MATLDWQHERRTISWQQIKKEVHDLDRENSAPSGCQIDRIRASNRPFQTLAAAHAAGFDNCAKCLGNSSVGGVFSHGRHNSLRGNQVIEVEDSHAPGLSRIRVMISDALGESKSVRVHAARRTLRDKNGARDQETTAPARVKRAELRDSCEEEKYELAGG